VVTDRATGARYRLGTPPIQTTATTGVISPDGTVAALREGGATSLHLVRLSSGADRRLTVPADAQFAEDTMVWSPDSRWLFVTSASGRLYPVDRATGAVHDLGVPLPPLIQLAVRNAAH
jgi:hypothetical protein